MLNRLHFEPAAPSPIARMESATAVAGGRMVVIGGHVHPDLDVTARVYAYDPAADRWERRADMPSAVTHVVAAPADDRSIWIVGGFKGKHPGHAVSESWCYDTQADRWSEGPPLPDRRASGGLAHVDGYLHYFGGLLADRAHNAPDHWVMDLAKQDHWRPLAPMPDARGHIGVAVVGRSIYAIGGHFGHDKPNQPGQEVNVADLDLVHRYDCDKDRWEAVADMPGRRSHIDPATAIWRGRIITVGGRNNSPHALPERKRRNPVYIPLRGARRLARRFKPRTNGGVRGLNCISMYDASSDRWSDLTPFPMELYATAAAVVGDRLIVTNGGIDAWRAVTDRTWVAMLA